MSFSYQAAVDKYRKLILDAEDYIWANPETGYREVKTSKYMEDAFEKLGYELVCAGDIPGFYTVIDTGREGPEILILGELDSLICADHPDAPGASGTSHGSNYKIANPDLACVASAKWQLEMLSLLLGDGAKRAKEISDGFTPAFSSKEEYFKCIDSFTRSGDRITYSEDGASIEL